jgi:hypothetical protein
MAIEGMDLRAAREIPITNTQATVIHIPTVIATNIIIVYSLSIDHAKGWKLSIFKGNSSFSRSADLKPVL